MNSVFASVRFYGRRGSIIELGNGWDLSKNADKVGYYWAFYSEAQVWRHYAMLSQYRVTDLSNRYSNYQPAAPRSTFRSIRVEVELH